MRRNIAAFTPPGVAPPFVAINEVEDGIEITVRSARADGGSVGLIIMGRADFLALCMAVVHAAGKELIA